MMAACTSALVGSSTIEASEGMSESTISREKSSAARNMTLRLKLNGHLAWKSGSALKCGGWKTSDGVPDVPCAEAENASSSEEAILQCSSSGGGCLHSKTVVFGAPAARNQVWAPYGVRIRKARLLTGRIKRLK